MPRRPQGSVVLRAGVRYARITLHREPPQHGRSPRAEVRITRPEGAGAAASRLGVDVATLRRWRAPGGWLHAPQGDDAG